MTQAEHDQARRELGFPVKLRLSIKSLRVEHNWPDMAQSLDDDEVF